jgi:hypothetical protein
LGFQIQDINLTRKIQLPLKPNQYIDLQLLAQISIHNPDFSIEYDFETTQFNRAVVTYNNIRFTIYESGIVFVYGPHKKEEHLRIVKQAWRKAIRFCVKERR